jgi:hypothetical protein
MRSDDHYTRLRLALTEMALAQSQGADRERWLALAMACPDQSERPTRDAEQPLALRRMSVQTASRS